MHAISNRRRVLFIMPLIYIGLAMGTGHPMATADDDFTKIIKTIGDSKKVCRAERPVIETIDNGKGFCRYKWPAHELKNPLPATQILALREIDVHKEEFNFHFAKEYRYKDDDGVATFGDFPEEKPTSITDEEACKIARTFLRKQFPDIAGRLKLSDLYGAVQDTINDDGTYTSETVSHSMDYQILTDSIPVYMNNASIRIANDKIQWLEIKYHNKAGPVGKKAHVLPARECLLEGLPTVKQKLGIHGKYEIFQSMLCYIDVSRFKGVIKEKDEFVLAWEFGINPKYERRSNPKFGRRSPRSDTQTVWINATTGKYLGHWGLGDTMLTKSLRSKLFDKALKEKNVGSLGIIIDILTSIPSEANVRDLEKIWKQNKVARRALLFYTSRLNKEDQVLFGRLIELPLRKWTNNKGKILVEARMVQFGQGWEIRLKSADGRTIPLQLNKLSKADQQYIMETFPEPVPKSPAHRSPLRSYGVPLRVRQDHQTSGAALSLPPDSPPRPVR